MQNAQVTAETSIKILVGQTSLEKSLGFKAAQLPEFSFTTNVFATVVVPVG